ncbi:hypothetical protein BDZ89DRAFT_1076368 [Hymenopellis radicata]|nr:hypothetical protein BDZ89DRAFT_1076368 [Hymenopellis radicata]
MLSFAKLSTLFALGVVAVHAQDSSSDSSVAATGTDTSGGTVPTGISACITTCATSGTAGQLCPDITVLTCVCTNAQYQTDVATCIQSTCPDEIAAAQQIQQQQCAAVGSGSASASASASVTGASSSRPASGTAGASTSHAASGTSTRASGTSSGTRSGTSAASTSNAAAGQVGGMDYSKVMSGAVLVAGILVGGNMLL